jgi:ribokinase
MIVVFGSINLDFVFAVARLPQAGETLMAQGMQTMPGGKGANQAVAAARDGAPVIMVGAVGCDQLGDNALSGLIVAGVDITRVVRVDARTGCASIATAGGANQILVAAGANAYARAAQVEDALLMASTIVLIQMETDIAEVTALIQRASVKKARVVLNLAPATALPRAVLSLVHLLVVNEAESAFLAGELGCAPTAAAIHESLGIGVIRTLGSRGAEVATAQTEQLVPAEIIEAVDSTAAGDCFVGVFAAALDRGSTLEAALQRATAAAALCCLMPGSQFSLPNAQSINERMSRAPRAHAST